MRTNDKEVAAHWDRLLVPFKGHLNMRSSIARGALALLSVVAITGCQSGSTWSPTWWNPFHTTPSYHVFKCFGSGGAGLAVDAGRQLVVQRLQQQHDRQPVLALQQRHAIR